MTAQQQPIDPDILSIQRGRRQRGECLICGRKAPRAVLCVEHRAAWAYCPTCENIFPRRPALNPAFSSEYCTACDTESARKRRGMRTKAEYLADIQAFRHSLLPELIKRYRRREPVNQIAAALGITPTVCNRIIRDARKRGEWPAGLWRCRHRKKARS